VVGVTHPASLQPKHIEEVIGTGTSSLRPPAEHIASQGSEEFGVERVPSAKPAFEVSVRRSGPLPAGHGVDCWTGSETSVDASGQYASVQQAILTLFSGRPTLLDCRTALSTEQYDFSVRLPAGATPADREQAVAPMFRSVFGLQIRRERAEREVYVLTLASTNAPGLTPSGPKSNGFGSDGPGELKLDGASLDSLSDYLEKALRKSVVNDTGLTNLYDIRVKWKMSKRELLPFTMDRQVVALMEEPDATNEMSLSAVQRRQLAAIRGNATETELQSFSAEERANIELVRAELARPDEEQFQPEPENILAAVREQLGLELSLQRRTMPVLVVEKPEPKE
jgi:uncharacterized protein (TIGR03435 family)